MPDNVTLYYVHDPMCSWCWGFSRALGELAEQLPTDIVLRRLLGGLAPDSDEPMPQDMQQMIQDSWHRIEQHIPDVKFNFDFWTRCRPRRSTYPSCRAVIAARQQGDEFDALMNSAIQHAYYQQARNPSDDDTLIALADELKLDVGRFKKDFYSAVTQQTLLDEIETARRLDVESFPSLVLQSNTACRRIPIDYTNTQSMLEAITSSIAD